MYGMLRVKGRVTAIYSSRLSRICVSRVVLIGHYGIVDFMFLQRDNATGGAVITEENIGGQQVPIFTTRSMQPATAPGVRLFYGELGPDCMGWEVGYLGVYGMSVPLIAPR